MSSGHLQSARYISDVIEEIDRCGAVRWGHQPVGQVPERVFEILTRKEFCYLTKSRVAPYKHDALGHISRAIARGAPIPFYLDLGGGYHASLAADGSNLCFEPGLGELLVMQQAARFHARVRELYAPGICFTIVIDNLCALLVNDIPTSKTEAYCAQFRRMVREARTDRWFSLLVESEAFRPEQYPSEGAIAAEVRPVTELEHGNVERFLGRRCDAGEAAFRRARYAQIGARSEELLGSVIDGVHMTQRASPTTLCFRAFPGSDCRIQAGEVALRETSHADGLRLKPFLLTSRNAHEHRTMEVKIPPGLGRGLVDKVIISQAQQRPDVLLAAE